MISTSHLQVGEPDADGKLVKCTVAQIIMQYICRWWVHQMVAAGMLTEDICRWQVHQIVAAHLSTKSICRWWDIK